MSEARLFVQEPEDIALSVLKLGVPISQEAVVVGSGAVYAALGKVFRTPNDIDLAVSENAYRYLRLQTGWEETYYPDGRSRLMRDGYDIGIDWGERLSTDQLRERSWKTAGHVAIAGLPDIYAWKQTRGSETDESDTAFIRDRLQDSDQAPLAMHLMQSEEAIVRASLPDHLQNDSVALRLITDNVLTDYTLYGDPRIGRANQIIGDLELSEYGVPALYHNGFGIAAELARMTRRFVAIDRADQEADRSRTFTEEDQYDALIAHSGADCIYGNGRQSDTADGYDELRSANRSWYRAVALGYTASRATRIHTATDNTGFNERTGKQKGQHHPDPVVREVVGSDLRITSELNSLEETIALALEDNFSRRFSDKRVLGRVAVEHGIRIRSLDEGIAFVDEFQDVRPTYAPDGQTVIEAVGSRVVGSGNFHDLVKGYQAPDGYPVNHDMRREHLAVHLDIGQRLINRTMSAAEALKAARRHTANMQERFGTA
jgi:hypothetical protein